MYTLPTTTGVLSGRHAMPLAPGWLALEFGCVAPAAVHPCRRRSRSEPEQEALWSLGRIDLALLDVRLDAAGTACKDAMGWTAGGAAERGPEGRRFLE